MMTYEEFCSIEYRPQTGREYLMELRMNDEAIRLLNVEYPKSDDTLPF